MKMSRRAFEKASTSMMLKSASSFVAIKIAVGCHQYIALMRAVNDNSIALVEVHSFM